MAARRGRIVARAAAVIDAPMIDAAPQLRVIGRSGVGVEHVDLERGDPPRHPRRRDAQRRDTRRRRGRPRADAPSRQAPRTADEPWSPMNAGREREAFPVGDLDGATLAVIGYGRIGRRVAELARGFGMRVLAHDPYAEEAPCGFEEALGAADVISLHAPLTAETHGLIGDAALRLVKPGAVLINCGRGGLLDLDAATTPCSTIGCRRRPRRLRPRTAARSPALPPPRRRADPARDGAVAPSTSARVRGDGGRHGRRAVRPPRSGHCQPRRL